MPWIIPQPDIKQPYVTRHPAPPGPASPEVTRWAEENPWMQDFELKQAAIRIYDDLIDSFPTMPAEGYLGRVLTRMRQEFPGRVPDHGHLCCLDGPWIGAIPLGDAADLLEGRPHTVRLPLGDARVSPADRLWFLPIEGAPSLSDGMLGNMVASLDSGGSVCLYANGASSLEEGKALILAMTGGGRA